MTDESPDLDRAFRDRVDFPNPVLYVLWAYGGRFRGILLVGILTATAVPLLNLVPAYLLGTAIDAVVGGSDAFRLPLVPDSWLPTGLREQLLLTFVLLAGTGIALLAFETTDSLAWSRLEYDIAHDLRTETYDAAQRHGMAFFTSAQTGDVMNVLSEDMGAISNAPGGWLKSGYQFVVTAAGLAIVMASMNWQLAVVALAFGIPLGITSYFFHRRVSRKYTDLRRAGGQMNARLESGISGVSTVKAYGNEAFEHDRLVDDSRSFHEIHYGVHREWSYWAGFSMLFERGAAFAVLLVGGWIVLHGPPFGFLAPVSVGVFVTFFVYAQRFADQLSGIGNLVRQYDSLAAAARRVFGLMHYPVSVRETEDPTSLETVTGRVAFEDVTFTYPGTSEAALADVSFEADPGTFVGLVGQTGAGKSTVCKLLLRFYDPDEGVITIDGHDVRDLRLTDLRGAVGYVEQEPFLFDDTVRNNLTYANRDASEAEMIDAAKRARAHEFVTGLPDGYDTEVGERGVKLSGGQRQRLVIARTLLADPPILILDEATSHVDNETELLIQRALDELIANRTTIAIAHRLSTVKNADQLLVLEEGTIVERGTHESLLAARGVYATLWESHTGADEVGDV